jgi:iron complex transport system substrate-binding protein
LKKTTRVSAAPQAAAHRIVSLAPSASSILWAIGAQRHVVGVTKWCADVAPVGRLPRVGDCWAGDVQDVARLRPTLILGSVPFNPEMLARLLELGKPLLAMNPRSLQDIYDEIQLLGGITGRAAAAERVAGKMQRDLALLAEQAARRLPQKPMLRVYCEAWPNPRIASPPWVDELVRMAGAEPAVSGGQKVSDQDVARAKPDIIVLAWAATGAKADLRRAFENPVWRGVPAVRNRRVFVVRDELLNTPSPVLVQGFRALIACLDAPPARS